MPEGEFTNRKPAISSLRRNLQRDYLKRLSQLAMGDADAPQDCQTVAYAELSALEGRINNVLKSNAQARRLQPGPPGRNRQPHPQGARRPAESDQPVRAAAAA